MQYTSFFNTHEAIVEDAVFERVQKVDIIFNFVGGESIFFLPRNRNSKTHRNLKRRYSPCNRGYTA